MVPYRITFTEERPADVTVRAWRSLMREAHADVMEWWHRHILPQHFEPHARFKYRYRPRAPKTHQNKQRDARRGKALLGGLVDLVHTGRLREALTRFATIRGFPTRGTLTMAGPRYISMTRKSGQPPLAAEATRVADDEARRIADMLNEQVTQGLNDYRAARTVTL